MAKKTQTTTSFGEFTIEDKIGDGPIATVYKAQKDGQPCALKILKDSALPKNAAHRKKLLQTLQALPTINHRTVVKVLEGGEQNGKFYVAMELMECPTLAQRLAKEQMLGERDIVLIARQVAQGLETGYAAHIYHGDLTPDNIFETEPNKIKLTDFAIKKYLKAMPGDIADEGGAADARGPSAENLLRTRGQGSVSEDTQKEFAGLAMLMMTLSGLDVPEREEDEPSDKYREKVLNQASRLSIEPHLISPNTVNMVTRLLSPSAFSSHNAVVVELATAVLFLRKGVEDGIISPGKKKEEAPPAPEPPAEAAPEQEAPADGQKTIWTAEAATKVFEPSKGAPEQEVEEGEPVDEFEEPDADVVDLKEGADVLLVEAGTLVIWRDEDRGEFYVPQEGKEFALGRDPDQCDLAIADSRVSRRHCVFTRQNNQLWLTDNKSANGTSVNGERVESVELSVGDIIHVGTCIMVVGPALPQEQ